MAGESIQAIMLWPGEHPCMTNLLDDPIFLDFAVGLGSEFCGEAAVLRLSDTAAIIYNRDALLWSLRGNRRIGSKLLAGVVYVVGIEEGRLTNLSFQEMEYYFERLWEPESYSEEEVKEAYLTDMFGDLLDLI